MKTDSSIPSFNVLDRNLDIHRHYVLEASAGTGKTFSVENLVVRLLVEDGPHGLEPLTLPQILVVTFTRAATRDLRLRIRGNIEKALDCLNHFSQHGTVVPDAQDYLRCIIEKGKDSALKAQKQLEQALFCFDEAQIFTIHAFCHRALREHIFESGISLDASGGEEPVSTKKLLQVINDFLRTEVRPEIYSVGQFQKLASDETKLEELKWKLLKKISTGFELDPSSNFQEQLEEFNKIMSALKAQGVNDSRKIVEDFKTQAPGFKDICDRKGEIKQEHLDKVIRFAELFDRDKWHSQDLDLLIRDGLYLTMALSENNRKKKEKHNQDSFVHYPALVDMLNKDMAQLVCAAGDGEAIKMRLAANCQKHLKKYMEQEEISNFDDLLKEMQRAVEQPGFAELIRNRYRAAIIDEFQDTDPVQWGIFKKLFPPENQNWGHLYLVGDPKQSIYSFRHADIYTYMEAAEALGPGQKASLDTNYRSQTDLVDALNILFSKAASSDWIKLPHYKDKLEYREVRAGGKIEPKKFGDSFGSIHFVSASYDKAGKNYFKPLEKAYFFPFITQEILRLNAQDGIRLKDFAVLTDSHRQAKEMSEALKKCGIPSIAQRNSRLADAQAVPAMRELLCAVISPKHESSLKTALGGPIIGWTHAEIQCLDDSSLLEKILLKFLHLRATLARDGIGRFFQELMQSKFHTMSQSIIEKILARAEGLRLYNDLLLIAELLADFQSKSHASHEGLIAFLDDLKQAPQEDDNSIKCRNDPEQDGVNILTIHSSKGLEYGVVFALGLGVPAYEPDSTCLDKSQQPPRIVPILDKDSADYRKLCEEKDAEKMRHLYVAMTRAKYRLYVPAAFPEKPRKVILGKASPMELFLAHLKVPQTNSQDLYDRINTMDRSQIFKFISELGPHISIKHLADEHYPLNEYPGTGAVELRQPPFYSLPGTPQFMLSYSSITKGMSHEHPGFEINPPHDYAAQNKTPHTLPSGSMAGNLLHEILESVPLGAGDLHGLQTLVSKNVSGTDYAEWKDVFGQIVKNALHTPLPIASVPVSLTQIDPRKTYRETEFAYPWPKNLKIEGVQHSNGFLKGVIDLVFEHQGKYYILDWKSNWLGPSVEDYHKNNLEAAMRANDYFLQANVYTGALRLYLKKLVQLPFEEIFGGVIYVFLRGLSPEHGPQYGIYHFHPHIT